MPGLPGEPVVWFDESQATGGQLYPSGTFAYTGVTATYAGNTISYNAGLRDRVWYRWNQAYTTATIANYTIDYTTTNVSTWQWQTINTVYEETAEQRVASLTALARRRALGGSALTDEERNLLTDDEIRAWEDLRQRRAEEELERQRALVRQQEELLAAGRRAEQLLLSLLDADGKREWLEHRRVSVEAPSGRRYRLFPVWAGGVALMGQGEVRQATLCVHPRERLPEADVVVANMLAIEHHEEEFLKIAILHDGSWPADVEAVRRNRRVERVRADGEDGYIEIAVA